MAITQACYVENGKAVGGVTPDAASAIGYKENVGGTCVNPNGYTAGSFFMASNNGYMYKALANIAYGDAFQIGTNCEQTNVSSELSKINTNLTVKYENGKTYVKENGVWVERSFGMPVLDYAHPLHTFSGSGNLTWTATEDCWVLGSISAWNGGNGNFTIDGTNVAHAGSWNSDTSSCGLAPLKVKQGSVMTASYDCNISAFKEI